MPTNFLTSAIQEFSLGLAPGLRILDVGCGLRPFERFFTRSTYLGIDVEVSGRDPATKKPDKYFDGLTIPYGDEEFDLILNTEVLEHCIDPEKLLSEMHRVLKKGGMIYLTAPFIWGEHEVPYDFRRYSRFGMVQLFEKFNFKIQKIGSLANGVDAIETLVGSEIHQFKRRKFKAGISRSLARRALEKVFDFTWRAQLKVWRKLYKFDRIYLDVQVIAIKGPVELQP